MKELGGSLFIRNAIQYDYCVQESILSLLPVCDQVVVLDCQSDDGTTEMLDEFCSKYPQIKYVTGGIWEAGDKYFRLSRLANEAKSHLTTPWHFMIQADEVLHEDSYPFIEEIVKLNRTDVVYAVRRINLWGDVEHYIGDKIPIDRHPCGPIVARLGAIQYSAHSDAESLGIAPPVHTLNVKLFHYGFVRDNMINKCIDMQRWFHATDHVDPKLLELKENNKDWDPDLWHPRHTLNQLDIPHPAVAQQWVSKKGFRI